jgi:[acyl-carrier-protein] S-malonyltransferase
MVAHGVDTIVEIGPKQVLSGLIKRITPDARPISLTDAEVVKLLTTVGTTEPV